MTQELIHVDNRSLIIVNYNLPLKDYVRFKKVVLRFCKKEKLAKLFPEIMVVLETPERVEKVSSSRSGGFVLIKEIRLGIIIIYLNPKFLLTEKDSTIYGTLIHEITHAWHETETKLLSSVYDTKKRLGKRIKAGFTTDISVKTYSDLYFLRHYLLHFSRFILIEGLANFAQKTLNKKFLLKGRVFKKLYRKAWKKSKQMLSLWKKALNSLNSGQMSAELKEKIKLGTSIVSYPIGEHMVYTLRYFNREGLESLGKMKLFQFIEGYEKAMLHNGYTPVFSLKSGAGNLDYQRMLNELTAAYEKSKVQ